MRGFFGIGSEGISKEINLGSLLRSAHAFGASFVFTVNSRQNHYKSSSPNTSKSDKHVPLYHWQKPLDIVIPQRCKLVGIEITEESSLLPNFHHPLQAMYILGPEKGSLSQEMVDMCDYVVKIPTKFCLNLQIAGAIVMYDRVTKIGTHS